MRQGTVRCRDNQNFPTIATGDGSLSQRTAIVILIKIGVDNLPGPLYYIIREHVFV